MIADVAAYYGQSPLQVELWKTLQIKEWHDAALSLEKKQNKKSGQEP